MHARNPVAQSTSPGISHRYPCLCIVFVNANSGCFQSCHLWLQLRCHFFFSEKHVVVDDVCGKSHCVGRRSPLLPLTSEKALYKLLRLAPVLVLTIKSDCLLSQILNVNAIAHAFADSQEHIPRAIAEREGLTMITVERHCERSKFLRMPVNSPCVAQHVPQNGSVCFCQTLNVFCGGLPLLRSTSHFLLSA